MAPGLLNMPEVVMSKIMETTGIKAIFTLRKVCHDLRNFIDDVKPDAKFEEIWLYTWMRESIVARYQIPGGDHLVWYQKHEQGCLVQIVDVWLGQTAEKERLLKNEDFLTACMKDFEIVLGHQKSVLKNFILMERFRENMDVKFRENVQRILKSRIHPLKVEKFTADSMDQNQIISILPLLDSKTLNTLEVDFKMKQTEVYQLIKTEQWKNIKHIVFKMPIDLKYIQYFTHFSTVDVSFKSDQFPDLVSLKNLFLKCSGFKTTKIKPNTSNINYIQRSIDLLGQSIVELDTDKETKHVWYYRIPNTNQVLEINVYNYAVVSNGMEFKLTKIEKSSVPQGAVIQY